MILVMSAHTLVEESDASPLKSDPPVTVHLRSLWLAAFKDI